MSQQAIYDLDFKDENLLLEALKEMGYQASVHEKPIKLKTYRDLGNVKAHIVISKEQGGFTYADMGFERMNDGSLKLHADHIDINKINMSELNQRYSKAFLKKKISLMGSRYLMDKGEIEEKGQKKVQGPPGTYQSGILNSVSSRAPGHTIFGLSSPILSSQ